MVPRQIVLILGLCVCASTWLHLVATSENNLLPGNTDFRFVHRTNKTKTVHGGSAQVQPREKRSALAFVGGVLLGGALFFAGMSRSDAEDAARRYNEQMEFQLMELCTAICVTEWEAWGSCSEPCGGGKQTRNRHEQVIGKCADLQNFECPYSLTADQPCNPDCPNGGRVDSPGVCKCQPTHSGQCCQTEVTCPYPNRPSHGQVSGTWPAKYGSVALFSCNSGYALVGSSDITCQTTGTWSAAYPTCEVIKCQAPTLNEHVTLLNSKEGYAGREELFYVCEDGYSLVGPQSRRCEDYQGTQGRWTGFDPHCTPISCEDPGVPLNGHRQGNSFKYQDEVSFSCEDGFRLLGSQTLTCLASGNWLGRIPQCDLITCEELQAPRHGSIDYSRTVYAGKTIFSCDQGHILQGHAEVTCTINGTWNFQPPRCEATSCGNPGSPDNGAKDGSIYIYPHNVTYHCYAGYTLRGTQTLSCQADGTWNAPMPVCEACPLDTYLERVGSRSCLPCPTNSHTSAPASTSRQQCVCAQGYNGQPGGPCEEIRCPLLPGPDNGFIGDCDTRAGSVCNTTCNEGYIVTRGSSARKCQETGQWDGRQAVCSACGKDTYKQDERSCLPCPAHSHTVGVANRLQGCVCNEGWTGPPGGPCQDVDECIEDDGHGPCSDLCHNENGTYTCSCSIRGYIIDPKDPHTCIVDQECRNLTEADAPENGGLVCHWYREMNSKHCEVRCNKGYDFTSRTNDYEVCGPSTGFIWSHQQEDSDATIDPCIEEYFPDYQMEASSAYFVRACSNLTETEKLEVYQQFKAKLDENGICKRRTTKVCDVSDMAIICGRTTRRRRDTGETLDSLDLGFGVKALKQETNPSECPRLCGFLRIPGHLCQQYCLPTYRRFLAAAVMYAKRQLMQLYRDVSKVRGLAFEAAQREFNPVEEEDGLTAGGVQVKCAVGMKAVGVNCVPCPKGTYYSTTTRGCEACPAGTFMPLQGQTACVNCPLGTTSGPKAARCHVCPANTYGPSCSERCECVHGRCDPRDGTCQCDTGYEGPLCDTDTDGCTEDSCLSGQPCTDIPAPGMGFSCGS